MTKHGMSAYQPEGAQSAPPEIPQKKSVTPKVLGIVHIVLGGLTVVSGMFGLLSGKSQADTYQEKFAGVDVVSDEVLESLSVLDMPSTLIAGGDLLVSLVMVVAGVGLVKYKHWGRVVSNVYAVLSLLLKGVNVYVMTIIAAPFYEALLSSDEQLEIIGVDGLRAVVLVSILMTAVYPIVALILVNLKFARSSLR